jgi:hypothetical protein
VEIGGERDDAIDPDFMVYNDVIVSQPEANGYVEPESGNFDIYGYPKDVFPPTDGHTATFVPSRNEILILGNMSEPQADQDSAANGNTVIYTLDVGTWKMTRRETTGDGPGVIWFHEADLQGNVLRVTGKAPQMFMGDKTQRRVMFDGSMEKVTVNEDEEWTLDLETMTWTHRESEWQTVEKKKKKKKKKGRGGRAAR